MIARRIALVLIFTLTVAATWPYAADAQGGFESVSGDALVRAVPGDFYLEGNRIPVEKRNAVLLKTGKGSRVVIALIDTTGYSSQIQQKYIGMVITEANISVCGNAIGVGSYGFGLERPPATSNGDAHFRLYNQAGEKLAECGTHRDDTVKQPRPLMVVTDRSGTAKLYLGRFGIEIK
jgi:hypothetical protein